MKNSDAERQVSRYRYDAMLCFYKYPELDLTARNLGVDYENAFYVFCTDDREGHAQNTTAWD